LHKRHKKCPKFRPASDAAHSLCGTPPMHTDSDGQDLGFADVGRVEAVLGYGDLLRGLGVGCDLADAQVAVGEHLEAAALLSSVVLALAAPADHGLLVASGGQRRHPSLAALALEALVGDEA